MKNFHRNIIVPCVAVCFATTVWFGGSMAAAQTKTSPKTAKAATTTKTQKPTAKPATKTAIAIAAPAPKKTTAKTSDKSKAATVVKVSTAKSKLTSATKAAATPKEKAAFAKSPTKSASAVKSASTVKTGALPMPATIAKSSPNVKSPAKITTPKTAAAASAPQIIVSATSARVRSEPTATASVVSTVGVGKIFSVSEENSIWYRVRLAGDKSGWISKQIAVNFDDSNRAEIYRKIAAKYLKSKMDFAAAAQIFDFLTEASGEVKKPDEKADFSFKRLQVLNAALKNVPLGKSAQNPYKDFLKANEKEVVYSEPSGEWLVRSDVFWETHAKYKETTTGEEIAWAAAQTSLPGECEGYVNCYLYLLRVTDGEYLNFYPSGKYARKSVQNITSLLEPIVADLKTKTVYMAATDISDRAEFNRLLTELRAIISKVPFVEKAKTMQQINQIGEGFR